ncbi:hypothetical protein CH368_08525 [Leptospira levettii]|nr:hypothetical protein CH368_08525 [Leptospira levettii]
MILDKCAFMKNHTEDSFCFDSASLVMDFSSNLSKLNKPEYQPLGFLWAYKDGKFSFIKYFTMEEISKLSRN